MHEVAENVLERYTESKLQCTFLLLLQFFAIFDT